MQGANRRAVRVPDERSGAGGVSAARWAPGGRAREAPSQAAAGTFQCITIYRFSQPLPHTVSRKTPYLSEVNVLHS